jgi:signal transduction histidine kinase
MNEDLKQAILAYQMAAQMLQFKTGFLARVSHELRSPLSSLISLHQLILSDLCDNPAEEREFIKQAHQSAFKIINLIDNIIDVAKVEYGTKTLAINSIEITEILLNIYNLLYLQATNKNLQFKINYPDTNIKVLADKKRLQQVLISLIDAGIYIMDNGSIQVESKVNCEKDLVEINLKFDCQSNKWSESVNLLEEIPQPTREEIKNLSQQIEFSPGMKLILAESLLTTMGGKLLLTGLENNITQIQCFLPMEKEGIAKN